MVEHLVKTLLDRNESIIRKAIMIACALLILYCIDTFTPYPSLYFTKEKYEAISLIKDILSDTSYSEEIRLNAAKDLDEIKDMHSFRDYRSSLGEKSLHINERVHQTINTNIIKTGISIIDVFLCYVLIVFWANISWIALIFSAYRSKTTSVKSKRDTYLVALKFSVINLLFSYFYLCYDPLNGVIYEDDTIVLASVVSSVMFGFVIISIILIDNFIKVKVHSNP